MKKKILICTALFLPGTKGGGPIRSIANLVKCLKDEYEIYIYTKDRDLGDQEPYSNIDTDTWIKINGYNVFYASRKNRNMKKIKKNVQFEQFHTIYVNSFFSTLSIKFLILIRNLKFVKVIIAPRGEFANTALGIKKIKKIKKMMYLSVYKIFIHRKDTIWHSTSLHETNDINNIFNNSHIVEIPNIGSLNIHTNNRIEKKVNNLKIVYMSRIAPIKNVHLSLLMLKEIKGNIIYDIYGPIEDKKYWEKCEKIINELPNNIKVNYKGSLSSDEIFIVLTKYHVFLLPTRGENFGHAIYEAMSSGCIPIISDNTPWRNLETLRIGWDISLDSLELFITALEECLKLTQSEFDIIRSNIFNFINIYNENNKTVDEMKCLLGN